MATKIRRSFTDEFKRESVSLLTSSGRPLTQVARELGIQPSMLRHWRDDQQTNGTVTRTARSPSSDGMSAEHAEIRRLEKELARAQMERDILKNLSPACSPPVAVETVVLLWPWRGSGRLLSGGDDPVKKRGPWAVAHLRVVTPSRRSRSGS